MAPKSYTIQRAPPLSARRARWLARLPLAGVALLALGLWLVFEPGLLSADSIDQYRQALVGRYNDWHPPLIAILLHFVLRLGGSLAMVTLAQCAALLLGVAALAGSWLRTLWPAASTARRRWIGLATMLLLLVPVSPLAFFAMTFWKDVWAALLLLWIGALLLDALATPSTARAAGLVALGIALGLVRHNALVVLPVLGAGLAVALWRRGRAVALGVAVTPLLLCLASNALLDRAFAVIELHPSGQIMALDLVGLCARSTRICADLPWTQAHILDAASLASYRPGDIGFIFWDTPPHVSRAIRDDYARLSAEYWRAVRTYPVALADIKLRAFTPMLGRWETYYFIHSEVVKNPFGLALDPRYEWERAHLAAFCHRVSHGPLRWISGVHVVWLAVGVAWLAAAAIAFLRHRDSRWLRLAIVAALPLAYAASYLAATPVHDFRFLYPATLFIQCETLAALGGLAQKPTGRAPSRAMLAA